MYRIPGMAQRELGKIELKENREIRPLCNFFMKESSFNILQIVKQSKGIWIYISVLANNS